jgi:hypothetical protein
MSSGLGSGELRNLQKQFAEPLDRISPILLAPPQLRRIFVQMYTLCAFSIVI